MILRNYKKVNLSLAPVPMSSVWKLPTTASAVNPSPFFAGELPPPDPFPPDPPDPSSPLSPHDYPPLLSANTGSLSFSKKKAQKNLSTLQTVANAKHQTTALSCASQVPESSKTELSNSKNTVTNVTVSRSETLTHTSLNTLPPLFTSPNDTFTILPPKSTSPINTNRASTALSPLPVHKPSDPSLAVPSPIPPAASTVIQETTHLTQNAPPPSAPIAPPSSLVERLRLSSDKSLERLAPVTLSASGRPRVLIPDTVFQKGAEIHKDFIVCYYNGKPPPFNQIQSVFNHMWGKGKKLEIHNNPLNRSTLVRIPNAYLREKILEKCIWYVGDSMFHTAQWSSEHSKSTPPLKAIKIWAHLTGVPLDLRHKEGLSLVAGLVGHPKETDDFTLNLVSLTVSHVKVEVDLTKPLPPVVEFERECGEVVEVLVHYPWVPPTCTHCHELGHIIRNCLSYTPPAPAPPDPPKDSNLPKTTKNTPLANRSRPAVYRKKAVFAATDQPTNSSRTVPLPFASQTSSNPKAPNPISNPFLVLNPDPPQTNPPPSDNQNQSTPSSPILPPRPSLKRSRSSPTFSLTPSSNKNPNPFVSVANLPVISLFNQPLTSQSSSPLSPSPQPSTTDRKTTFLFQGSTQLNGKSSLPSQ